MTRLPPRSDAAFFPVLLAALAHELGSPLAAIKGAATTLLDYRARLPEERIDGFLQSIDTQIDRLDGLLDDLVMFARIEVGTIQSRLEPVAVRGLLDRIVADLPPDQPRECAVVGDDAYVIADPLYLRKALTLLLTHPPDRSPQPTTLRLETLPDQARISIMGRGEPDLADPLTGLDHVIRSTDSNRSQRAAALLRPALSRVLIEWQGGQWVVEPDVDSALNLALLLPLATPAQRVEAV